MHIYVYGERERNRAREQLSSRNEAVCKLVSNEFRERERVHARESVFRPAREYEKEGERARERARVRERESDRERVFRPAQA